MLITLGALSYTFDIVLKNILMTQVEEEMNLEISHLRSTLQKESMDINREFKEIGKQFSVVIAQRPIGIIYMSSMSSRETEDVIEDYWNNIYEEEYSIDENQVEGYWEEAYKNGYYVKQGRVKEVEGEHFTSGNFHVELLLLPENNYFPDNSYMFLIKDISYVERFSLSIKVLLLILMVSLGVFHLFMINYVLDEVLRAIKDLNRFAGRMARGRNIDFSRRYEIRYGNKEVDTLIETFNSFINKIDETFSNMEEFSSNVSHELKTPIASMRSMIEVDLVQSRSAEEYRETMLRILEETEWMNNLIKELLSLTKNPDGLAKKFKPVKIAKLGNEICDLMELMALDSGMKLFWNFDEVEDCYVMCDSGSMKQVMMNLINNAIKYNTDEGWISVIGKSIDNRIVISIRDSGIGIKEENISKLTERFFREDNVRTHKKSGAGLGLSIVNHIIKAHGGSLKVESKIDQGSVFSIDLLCIDTKEAIKVLENMEKDRKKED